MPRPKTDRYWAARVGVHAEEGLRPPAITRELEAEATQLNRTDAPSERVVRRFYDEYGTLPEHVRREQARLHWPRSFVSRALPWEAARAALDLLRFRDEAGRSHPTVRHAKWFWYLRLASSSQPIEQADTTSFTLALIEYLEVTGSAPPEPNDAVQWHLAFEPWAGLAQKAAFDRSCERHPERAETLQFQLTGSRDELNEASARARAYTIGLHTTSQGELSNG